MFTSLQILDSTAGKVGVFYLPGIDKFERILNRNRAVHSDLPPPPKGWKDLVDIPEIFKTTPDGGDFLIMNEAMNPTCEDSARIIGFASRDSLDILQDSQETLAERMEICTRKYLKTSRLNCFTTYPESSSTGRKQHPRLQKPRLKE